MFNRRQLLILTTGNALARHRLCAGENGIPRVDYHVHIGDAVTLDAAISAASRLGVKIGVLEHAGEEGHGFAVTDDASLSAWVDSPRGKGVYKGIEAETLNWAKQFSKDVLSRLDYVQADALGLPNASGQPEQIWKPGFAPSNAQMFMDRYTEFHVQRIRSEPLDIFAMPTYLPASLAHDYDRLWTPRRMRAIVDAAVDTGAALEIDSRYRVPKRRFLTMARDAGVKFAFGSNFGTIAGVGNIGYCVGMYKKLGLGPGNLFRPVGAGRRYAL